MSRARWALALAGLVGQAVFQGSLSPGAARRVFLQIQELARNPAVRDFAAYGASQLEGPAGARIAGA